MLKIILEPMPALGSPGFIKNCQNLVGKVNVILIIPLLFTIPRNSIKKDKKKSQNDTGTRLGSPVSNSTHQELLEHL